VNGAVLPVTVLLYHEIVAPGSPLGSEPDCIPLPVLLEHVEALADAGFGFASLHEAMEAACSGGTGSDRPGARAEGTPLIAFTFDDGYEGLHRHLPELAPRLRPTVFLLPEYLGATTMTWNLRATTVLRHLTLAQARELAGAAVTLEAHGMDHHNLLKFRRDELRRRCAAVAGWFCRELGGPASYLAFPYGACSPLVEEVAAEFFRGAVSVNHGRWYGPEARFALNRISVPSYLTGAGLLDVIRTPPADRWRVIEEKAPWRA
jgi:peptidoglycan/xylan/chitin deacetylase (PgdA/CDA1 family)